MPGLNHTHTYKRVPGDKNLYQCIHPDCTTVMPRKLLRGKRARCVCGNDFIMDNYQLTLVKPHCDSCTDYSKLGKNRKPKTHISTQQIQQILSEELEGI